MGENIIVNKSEDFAVRIVNLNKILRGQRDEYIMSKQLIRCGTSIGANIAEAQEAQSDTDFIAKLYISLKECSETRYWLKLLYRTEYLSENEYHSICNDASELKALLTAIIKSKKQNMKSV
ncbi:MAG: four helix bundle protein [Muribaculaceae bacterium]|nr:four helix bundle protein [Muribaculaceae bacterium]